MIALLRRFLNRLLGRAALAIERQEDPERRLSEFVAELGRRITELQRAVAAALADETRLRLAREQAAAAADEWAGRALRARESGDEALAAEAEARQREAQAKATAFGATWETQRAATARLRGSLEQARAKVAEAKRQYNLLVARHRSAVTTRQLAQDLSLEAPGSPMREMQRIEQRILALEAANGAEPASAGELDARFEELEREQAGKRTKN